MAKRESVNQFSPESKVSAEECGNINHVKMLDANLKHATECMEAVQKMSLHQFNNEQCEYLVQKLEVVVHSASSFLEILRAKCHASSSSMEMTRGVEIFKLLLALAKQIESFIHGCYKDTWIQSAMTLTNVPEHVSSIGFNLELCRVAFSKNCVAIGITLDEVDGISKGEVEIVEKKASTDVEALFDKVLLIMPSLSHENKDLAIYLLQRLKRVKPIPASIMSTFSLISTNDGGFFGKLFKRIQQPVHLGTCASGTTVDKAMWLGTEVAVKTFYGPDDPDFMKEVEILKGLCHPNITSMFCSAMDRRRCSIIMELMDEDLHALMQRRLDANSDSPPFSILEAVDIMVQIGEGVNYLHNKRIVHRDLKSMNILIKSMDKGGSKFGYVHAKVNDFGLSKIKATNTRFSTLTTNTGTNKWMAPEIIPLNGGSQERHAMNAKMPKYPHKVDVYSFAMVCYEILTGQVPFFQIMTPSIVKMKVLNGDRPELPLYCPSMLKTLIEECWNQEPIKRPSFDNICKRLKYLKCLLMTNPHLTIKEPFQESMKDMTLNVEEKMSDPMKHVVFVSHSGAQKSFAEQLCEDLIQHDIYPFFDRRQDSLPIGSNFPSLIFEAIQKCEVGVLILSLEFFYRSKWPMFELLAMVKEMEKPNSSIKIIPVYYNILPSNVFNQENMIQWKMLWEKWASHDKRINVEEWIRALNTLKKINGIIEHHHIEEVFLQRQVITATLNLMSPKYWSRRESNIVQGRLRLFEELYKNIFQQEHNGVCMIGLYGMEGIGKTTICTVVCDELSEDFLGKVCYVELETRSEVEVLRHVLKRLTNINDTFLSESNINQYYDRLQRYIHKHRVLLVIDNVSTSLEKIEQAKSYLKAEYAPNSVVLVATRSLGTLQSLNIDEANCFEMPKLEDEEARSLFLYHAAPNYEVDEELLERCMVSVKQFFAGVNDNNNYHYHPIALKKFGLQLGFRPDQWEEKLTEWTKHQPIELFGWRKSFDMLTPDSRPSFLRQSFNMLELEDQLFYMDVALFYPEPPEHGSTLKQLNIFKWLSLVHGISVDVVTTRLEGLKTKWLLEHLGDGSTRIGMHPLARDLCESEANGGELASRRWVYNDAEMFEEHLLPEHGAWKCMQRISLRGSGFRKELNLKYCTDVLVLKLVRCHIENHVLDLTPLTLLKSLEILSCTSSVSESSPVQVRGLGLLRNLLLLKWDDMPSGPLCIEEIGLLTKLQILELDSRESENTLPDVGRLCLLREATFRFGYGADTISGLSGTMNTLRILDLGGCHRLLSCDGVGQLVALEELDLSDCLELEELPNLQNLTNLKKLDISGCRSITDLPGLDELGWALRDLNLCDCSLLRKLPYLGKLKNLRKLEMRGCFAVEELLGLGHCWALEELDLQGCSKLRRFDDQLGNLCHLRKVDISDCCLVESVPGLNDLICLQEFRAERCSGLVELPDLRKLSNLLVLNINLER